MPLSINQHEALRILILSTLFVPTTMTHLETREPIRHLKETKLKLVPRLGTPEAMQQQTQPVWAAMVEAESPHSQTIKSRSHNRLFTRL